MPKIKKAIKRISIPWYVTLIFAVAAIALVPWLIHLSYTLPTSHLDQGWDKAWTGLDIAEFTAIGLTALCGMLRSNWIVITATIAGTLLLVDAWFDTLTASTAHERASSLLSALLLEIPLALIAYFVAYKVMRRITASK